MKQKIIIAFVMFSLVSCTHPGDTSTPGAATDSSAVGTGVGDSSASANSPNGINGDTAMQRQGMSAGSSDSMGLSRGDSSRIGGTDSSNTGNQSGSKSGKGSKDTVRGKRNHYPDSSKRRQ